MSTVLRQDRTPPAFSLGYAAWPSASAACLRERCACTNGLSRSLIWTGGQARGHPGIQHELHLHHAHCGRHAAARASRARPVASRSPPARIGCPSCPSWACRLPHAARHAMWRSQLAYYQAPYRVSREALAAAGAKQAPHSRRRRNSCDARAPQCVTRQACAHESKAMSCSHGA